MKTTLNLINHFSLLSAVEVNNICIPLNKIGISYFNYVKIYSDGSRELLTNNPDWIEFFYENKLYHTIGVINIEYLLSDGYFLWSELEKKDLAYIHGREIFNIDNGITFVEKHNKTTALYIFGSKRNNHEINNFYLRNIDLFKRFILYFHDKGKKLLENARRNKIILPEKQIIQKKQTSDGGGLSKKERNEFIELTDIKTILYQLKEKIYI